MLTIHHNVSDGQADGQTTYYGNTALCVASYGKIGCAPANNLYLSG